MEPTFSQSDPGMLMPLKYDTEESAIMLSLTIGSILLLYLFVFFVLRYIIRRLWRVIQPAEILGSDHWSRMSGLFAAVLIFPQVASDLIVLPISFLVDRIQGMLSVARNYARPGSSDMVGDFTYAVMMAMQELGTGLRELLVSLFSKEFFFFIFVWMLIARLVRNLGAASAAGAQDSSATWLAGATDRTKHYLVLSLIFIVGCYLSIASIIAEPWMKESLGHSTGSFTDTTGLTLIGSQHDTIYDAGVILRRYRGDLDTKDLDIGTAYKMVPNDSAGVTDLITAYDQGRTGIVNAFRTRLAQAAADIERLNKERDRWADQARKQYKLRAQSIGVYERTLFMRNVNEWYEAMIAQYADRISSWESYLGYLNMEANEELSRKRRTFQGAVDDLDRLTDPTIVRDTLQIGLRSELMNSVKSAKRQLAEDVTIGMERPQREIIRFQFPAEPDPGAQWAIFGWLAGWLLKTKSPSMVLIIGMMGFGLLGAAITQFIRTAKGLRETEEESSIGAGLAVVLIRGFSAAIVVFLVVKGGLALFTRNDPEPNPYVIFLACLVGAVFSDGIWRWAKDWIEKQFTSDSGGGEEPPPEKPKNPATAPIAPAQPMAESAPAS